MNKTQTVLRLMNQGNSAIGLVLALALGFSVVSQAQELTASDDAVVNTGRHIYLRNCAICHGAAGKGDGDFSSLLVVAPTDLTTLAKRNEGSFPFEQVFETISGNELLPAHGSRDMPIWGQQFAYEAEKIGVEARSLMRARILELIAYLIDLQEK
ncbi:MAG: c-type cytochrome [Gammaproteobacteria bacterium]